MPISGALNAISGGLNALIFPVVPNLGDKPAVEIFGLGGIRLLSVSDL
jgi:hypothetical protein